MNAAPPAPRLAGIRSRWLGAATAGLHDDPGVAGAALVGSFGAGRADDWSDLDLLVYVDDARLDEYAAPGRLPSGPGVLSMAFDSRHNGPRGTRALWLNHLADGLPLQVDWYVHPVSRAGWPADSVPVLDRRGFDRLPATFAELLGEGEREPPTPKGPVERQLGRLAMVTVAGRRIARRSPDTARMLEILGCARVPGASWRHRLTTLREVLDGFAALGRPDDVAAGHAYLGLVEQTLG
ncbi:nucleotidyltransferase domain-containing protein [Nonomuraea sp. PA05]|uniref:nucleotidyltransferase domain-containing protein n=1 Tax=Nonomuraea sp. PA05 TaxID=2604466 RepID=UPI0011D63411|nr:nucleotidyltransferase domain-containing protein [Nonomuraea sp. PA05]TYB57603.1 nucleotidyltransferase domain-containing protein [Nonomuraea sp. PA05]